MTADPEGSEPSMRGLDARQLFAGYYCEAHGSEAPVEVLDTFDLLRQQDDPEER